MHHFDKHFTIQEANALLPRVREIFTRILSLIDHVHNQAHGHLDSSTAPGRTNGKFHAVRDPQQQILKTIGRLLEEISQEGTAVLELSQDVIEKTINRLLEEITEKGIVIQDLSRGLIDFPSIVNGEEVFLCYELNDGDTIRFWHPLHTGYAGRTPLPPED